MDRTNNMDLSFFGAVTASISHEIKNRIAIINEQAGLLEDLVNLAERGKPIEPERLMRLAGNVQEQVARADRVIKNMNRFAHSVDNFWYSVDLAEVLDLIAGLCRRKADMYGCELRLAGGNDSIEAKTCPFSLVHLFWNSLDKLMADAARGKTLTLGSQAVSDGVSLWIAADVSSDIIESLASERDITDLVELLRGRIAVDNENQRIIFELPADPKK